MRRKALSATIAALLSAGLLWYGPSATADVYVGGGVAVAKQAGAQPAVDNGGAVCLSGTGLGIGGGCIPFGPTNYVRVLDANAGENVAFQVCIDNNGDGLCGGPQGAAFLPCGDDFFFSHDDAGNFFNALGPLPSGFRPGCGGGFPGYVVLLCEGVHVADSDDPTGTGTPHTHAATTGTIEPSPTGDVGFGDFCGGGARNEAPPVKVYEVLP